MAAYINMYLHSDVFNLFANTCQSYLPVFVENVLVATEMHPADGKACGWSSGKPTFWKTKHWTGSCLNCKAVISIGNE